MTVSAVVMGGNNVVSVQASGESYCQVTFGTLEAGDLLIVACLDQGTNASPAPGAPWVTQPNGGSSSFLYTCQVTAGNIGSVGSVTVPCNNGTSGGSSGGGIMVYAQLRATTGVLEVAPANATAGFNSGGSSSYGPSTNSYANSATWVGASGSDGTATWSGASPTQASGDSPGNYNLYQGVWNPTPNGTTVTLPNINSDAMGSAWVVVNEAAPPLAPTLQTPANGLYEDATIGLSFAAQYNSTDSANANARAMRLKLATSSTYNYYSTAAGAFQSTIVWNTVNIAPGASSQFGPIDTLTDQGATNWSMADQESLANLQGPFATDFTVNLQQAPSLTINFPVGTEAGSNSPPLEYTATPASGASITGGQFLVYPVAVTQAAGFAIAIPGTIPTGYVSNVTWSGNPQTVEMQSGVVLTQGQTYVCYAAVQETGPEWGPTVSSTFTINLDQPAVPVVAVSQVKTPAGSSVASIVVTGQDNLLSAADASFESSIGTWFGVNADLAQGQTGVKDGAYSLAIQGIATGAASAQSSGYAVVPGSTYTALGVWTASSGESSASLNLVWLDSSGSPISQASGSTYAPSSIGVQCMTSGVAPSNAATARPQLYIDGILTAQIAAPATPAVTTATTGGSIAASVTRYYVVTAVNSYGQTTGSTEVSIETGSTTSTNANTFTWAARAGAASYNVYIGTASGTETLQASGLTTTTYTDTAAALATGAALPTSNTTGETHFLDCVGIFPWSTDNLVYDSSLTNATESPVGSWKANGVTLGTAAGNWGVLNPSAASAEWVFYGNGTQSSSEWPESELVPVQPGDTWCLSSLMSSPSGGSGPNNVGVYLFDQGGTVAAFVAAPAAGSTESASVTYTVPSSGVTALYAAPFVLRGAVVPVGTEVTFSQIQLTKTSSPVAYQPGPLWTAGGFAGNQQVIVTRSDGFLLRQSPQTLAPVTQQCTFTDSEIPIGYKYTYGVQLYVQL